MNQIEKKKKETYTHVHTYRNYITGVETKKKKKKKTIDACRCIFAFD